MPFPKFFPLFHHRKKEVPEMVKKFVRFFFLLLVYLFVLEGSLQFIFFCLHGKWLWKSSASRIGYLAPVPDRRKYTLRAGYVDKTEGITINPLGFRNPLISPSASQVIVLLGDSVPFGAGVKDDETYPFYLDSLLREVSMPVRAVNAGVPSYTIRQSFDRLKLDVLKYYPHPLLITLQAANDVSLAVQLMQDYNPNKTAVDLGFNKSWPKNRFLKKLAIIHCFDSAVIRVEHWLKNRVHNKLSGSNEVILDKEMLRNVKISLERNLEFCSRRGIKVVLFPVNPFYYQTKNFNKNSNLAHWQEYQRYLRDWVPVINSLNALLVEETKSHPNALFFDIRSILDNYDRDKMYLDYIHCSPHGNAVIAREFFYFLERKHLISLHRKEKSCLFHK